MISKRNRISSTEDQHKNFMLQSVVSHFIQCIVGTFGGSVNAWGAAGRLENDRIKSISAIHLCHHVGLQAGEADHVSHRAGIGVGGDELVPVIELVVMLCGDTPIAAVIAQNRH